MDKKRLQELAGININQELLNEEEMHYNTRNNNYLYHYTDLVSMVSIIKDNYTLHGGKDVDYPNHPVSFSRLGPSHYEYNNKMVKPIYIVVDGEEREQNELTRSVLLVLDKDKLKQRYKIELYNDQVAYRKSYDAMSYYKKTSKNPNKDYGDYVKYEYEERIMGPVNIKNSLVLVIINIDADNIMGIPTKYNNYSSLENSTGIKNLKFVCNSLKQNNIKFSINHPNYLEKNKNKRDDYNLPKNFDFYKDVELNEY